VTDRHHSPSRVGARVCAFLPFCRLRAWRLWPCLLLACLSQPAPAPANDFEAEGLASGLAPVEASRIRLLTERAVLTQGKDDGRADATYVFHNPTSEPIATVFAFPEGCPEVEEDGNVSGFYRNPQFRDLKTLVRGQPVATRIVESSPWKGMDLCIGRIHAFDLTLAPNERVEVNHRYRFSDASGIGFDEVQYITRTGALWNGPIGSAEFVLSPRTAAYGLSWPDGFRFVGFEERTAGAAGDGNGEGRIVYRFQTKAWTPKQDFVVALHGWPMASTLAAEKGIALPCPDMIALGIGGQGPDPDAAKTLAAMSDADLALCRNLPYARHGYPFQRPELRAAFDREVAVPATDDPERRRFRLGAANPFYSDSLLDDTDRAYRAAIGAEQDRRAARAKTEAKTGTTKGASQHD
jgi:hypothetical protein